MKLFRHGPQGQEQPGIVHEGILRDLSGMVQDINGTLLQEAALQKLAGMDLSSLPEVPAGSRFGACVAGVGKFICIGLNYRDHADETGAACPKEPIIFMKATSAIQGPNDTVLIPRNSTKTDWEVELGVVIGKGGKYISPEEALEHVAGYCTINDVSEREFQMERGGTWDKGKCCDTFGPIGPFLVTRDEVPDPQNLKLWLEVDGHRYQDGTTANMIFSVAELVSYVSQFMSLHPGDIISTGTPAGVGLGQKPEPVFLKEGQTVRLEVEGLGQQVQVVAQDP